MAIWVSIKRTLTGKLAVDGQNLIYCVRFEENVQKPQKKANSWKCSNIFQGFGQFLCVANSNL